MTLADYKFIYFWEWLHRLLGRLIGLAFALPLAWFWVRGRSRGLQAAAASRCWRSAGCRACSAGSWSARACRREVTDVSHFWLSIHLLTALLTLAGLVWTALDMLALAPRPRRPARAVDAASERSRRGGAVRAAAARRLGRRAQRRACLGHLAADAGPPVPEVDWSRGAGWALTHDPFLLHFLHRWWAWVAVAALMVLARRRAKRRRRASIAIHSAFGTQIMLGIATVLSGGQPRGWRRCTSWSARCSSPPRRGARMPSGGARRDDAR